MNCASALFVCHGLYRAVSKTDEFLIEPDIANEYSRQITSLTSAVDELKHRQIIHMSDRKTRDRHFNAAQYRFD